MKKNYSVIVLLVLFAGFFANSWKAQNVVLVPFSGSNSVACGSNFQLQDHAGTGIYANNANGFTVIDAGFQGVINITGPYVTESCCDPITIYNGIGTTGTVIGTYVGTGNLNFTSLPGQTITVRFVTDGSVVYAGFDFTVTSSGPCFATPCSGTPPSNTVLPATYSTCPILLNPNLSLTTNYPFAGITYQWQSSTVSSVGPFSSIPNATLTTAPVPTLGATTWYQAVITCTNSGGTFTTSPSQFFVAGTTTNTVPYFEGFESIQGPNRLPNCSWSATNLNTATQTYTSSNSNNRIPRTGSDFAAFQNVPTGTNYFYSNGIQLEPGITYSANLWYQTEYFGFTNWSNLSLLFGANQTPTGLTQIASTSPAVSGPYKALGGTFTVATSGLYYVAIRATSSTGNAVYLSWDDLSVTIPCTPASGNTPTLTIGLGSSTVCAGDQVNLNASGAPQYSWNTGNQGPSLNAFPAQTTTYIVVGTNTLTNCSASQSVIVYVNPSPTVIATVSSPSICPGDVSYLSGIGATTYAWSNGSTGNVIGVSPTASTTYSLIGANSLGCAASTTVQVVVKPAPVINASSATTGNACIGDNVQLTAGGGATYQWLSSSSANLLNGSPINVRLTTSTTFTVIGTGANGCSAKAVLTQNVDACTGVSEAQALLAGVRVYPNPTNGVFTVELKAGSLKSVVISDITGRKVLEVSGNTASAEIDLTELANGVYYAAVVSENGTAVVRVVKN